MPIGDGSSLGRWQIRTVPRALNISSTQRGAIFNGQFCKSGHHFPGNIRAKFITTKCIQLLARLALFSSTQREVVFNAGMSKKQRFLLFFGKFIRGQISLLARSGLFCLRNISFINIFVRQNNPDLARSHFSPRKKFPINLPNSLMSARFRIESGSSLGC